MTTNSTPRSEFLNGVRATLPLEIGAIPFAIIFGALAVNSGISAAGAMGLSLMVYAGAAQFLSISLVAQGTGPFLIILTTFVVNLRHVLYSATLAPYMKHLSQRWMLPLGFWLTDETFVVTVQRYQQSDASPHKHWFHFGSSITMYLNWNLFTLVGVVAGNAIPESLSGSLGFSMTVAFIGMLIPMIKNRPILASVLVASVTAVIAYPLPNSLWIMVAAIAGVIAGVLVESRTATAFPEGLARQESLEGDATP